MIEQQGTLDFYKVSYILSTLVDGARYTQKSVIFVRTSVVQRTPVMSGVHLNKMLLGIQ